MTIIEVNNLNKSFGSKENKFDALKNINLKIEESEFVGIVGTSGSGKTTFLNILGLLDNKSSGKYLLLGEDTETYNDKKCSKIRNKQIGFVVQHFALIKDFTVYENVEIPLQYGNVPRKLRHDKIVNVLKCLGIEDKINSKISNLSGGQCQRVAIARALVNDPKLILADEPTGALDTKTTKEIISIFKELNSKGKTILIITHDEKVASECKRIIRIEDGRINLKENSNLICNK